MWLFANLFNRLDQTTKTKNKVKALQEYFLSAPEKDVLWAVALLSHRRPRRTVKTNELRSWAAECAGIPLWLFDETYHVVGDLAETIAMVHPNDDNRQEHDLLYWISFIQRLGHLPDEQKKEEVLGAWNILGQTERFVFNKVITGNFRVGVSQQLIVKSLAGAFELEENVVSHRLMGDWHPDYITLRELLHGENEADNLSRPYPFYLAHPLDREPDELGDITEWIAERKWDGIRGQLIVRKGKIYIWSRGEDLVTEKFPELAALVDILPDGTVVDGEIMPFRDGKPLSFSVLQTRIGRKNITRSHLEKAPVILIAYDLLEYNGEDIRPLEMYRRRELLEELVRTCNHPNLLLSAAVEVDSWEKLREERLRSRDLLCEGLMLKHRDGAYKVGRKRGEWWKWKVDALTIDAVMIYAMRGHGRRANLYTDYTFAVWDGPDLVPFTKAYSGLTDEEIHKVDSFVRKNTLDRFGPVRSVRPELVFEIAFEGISESTRHKSGLALRFPRISRWRTDKKAADADTIENLREMLRLYGEKST